MYSVAEALPRTASRSDDGRRDVLANALAQRQILGTREFHVPLAKMARLLSFALAGAPRPVLSLNRPQTGGRTLVHRLEWQGLVFTCVSHRPIVVG